MEYRRAAQGAREIFRCAMPAGYVFPCLYNFLAEVGRILAARLVFPGLFIGGCFTDRLGHRRVALHQAPDAGGALGDLLLALFLAALSGRGMQRTEEVDDVILRGPDR